MEEVQISILSNMTHNSRLESSEIVVPSVNRSVPFCNCEYPATTRSRHVSKKIERCKCGEDTSTRLDWGWDAQLATEAIVSGTEVIFHPVYSQGTSIIRGTEPLQRGRHHYWEMKILTTLSGTDIMLGIGTDKVNLQRHRFKFSSALGVDDQSWGYSYRGLSQHKGQLKYYGEKYSQGRIIGVYVDMFRGTLEFYLNRRALGRAYASIPRDDGVQIYPMASSTSAKSSLKLINAASFNDSLKFNCMKVLCKYPKLVEQVYAIPGLRQLVNDLWFLQFKGPKRSKEFQHNNLLLEDEALLCGVKKKKFNAAVEQPQQPAENTQTSNSITVAEIYDNMIIEGEDTKKRALTSSSASSSEDEELAVMISRDFFCNH